DLVGPLEESMASMEGLEFLFHKYGWEIELDEEVYAKLKQAIAFNEPLKEFIAAVDSILDNSKEEEIKYPDLEVIIVKGKALLQSVANYERKNLPEFTGPLKDADFWKDIADHVLDDILSTYMQRHLPVAHALLQFFGIICYEEVNNQAGLKTYYVKAIVDWDQLVKVVTNPLQ